MPILVFVFENAKQVCRVELGVWRLSRQNYQGLESHSWLAVVVSVKREGDAVRRSSQGAKASRVGSLGTSQETGIQTD